MHQGGTDLLLASPGIEVLFLGEELIGESSRRIILEGEEGDIFVIII
jgi:hypothetical protein